MPEDLNFVETREEKVLKVRSAAAKLSTDAGSATHVPNGDTLPPWLFNFTKGLEHSATGLLADPASYQLFIDGTNVQAPQVFAQVVPYRGGFGGGAVSYRPGEGPYRAWESPTAGHAFVLEGPDPQAVTMPPAPEVASAEFAAEIAEVYQMALSRDWPVAAFMSTGLIARAEMPEGTRAALQDGRYDDAATRLGTLRWFAGSADDGKTDTLLRARRRHGRAQTRATMFRGIGEDNWDTPFLSQFLVMGSGGATHDIHARASGIIAYGAQRVDQKVRVAHEGKDYMMRWADWLDVQNGQNRRGLVNNDEFVPGRWRPITRLRDLATYVHDDQLYQAYLNATLILLAEGFAFDPGIPYHKHSNTLFPFPGAAPGDDNREPFALFGAPHLLTLVTEVASRALKAVRYQKFSVHRRLRPEATAALFEMVGSGYMPGGNAFDPGNADDATARALLEARIEPHLTAEPGLAEILADIVQHNTNHVGEATRLLPMAFPEGSPMHPSYGAGHATVAGACVTLLKAFFAMTDRTDPTRPIYLVAPGGKALVSAETGGEAQLHPVTMDEGLTLQGELNKLAWNIANARNIAGVHYYTDYVESALLGEAITLGILREQMLAYHPNEKVTMTVPLLTRRTLPACLLTGQTALQETDVVDTVIIRSDGSLEGLSVVAGAV